MSQVLRLPSVVLFPYNSTLCLSLAFSTVRGIKLFLFHDTFMGQAVTLLNNMGIVLTGDIFSFLYVLAFKQMEVPHACAWSIEMTTLGKEDQ